jgi:hypothetical protein
MKKAYKYRLYPTKKQERLSIPVNSVEWYAIETIMPLSTFFKPLWDDKAWCSAPRSPRLEPWGVVT